MITVKIALRARICPIPQPAEGGVIASPRCHFCIVRADGGPHNTSSYVHARASGARLFGRAPRRAFGPGRFLGMAILWELIFFGLLRQAWVERHALGPLAMAQETIA